MKISRNRRSSYEQEVLHAEYIVLSFLADLELFFEGKYIYSGRLILLPEFFSERNKKIFNAIIKLDDKGIACDRITLKSELGMSNETFNMDVLQKIGQTLVPALYWTNVKILLDNYCIKASNQILKYKIVEAFEHGADPELITESLVGEIEKIRIQYHKKDEIKRVGDIVSSEMDAVEDIVMNPDNKPARVSTGYKRLDFKLGRLLEGNDMFVIAGRPGSGKTSLVMNMVEHAAIYQDIPVGVFTLEMSALMLVRRLISAMAGVPLNLPVYNRDQIRSLARASAILIEKNNIFIDETPAITLQQLKVRATKFRKINKIGVMAIDYLQLMTNPAAKTREQEVSSISAGIKNLIKVLDIPAYVLAQLNRQDIDNPSLANLRESGSVEQDADIVGLLSQNDETTMLNIAKNRNGPTDRAFFKFQKETTKFYEPEREAYNPSED